MYKDGKWAKKIIALQDPDGKWGCFHSLAQSYGAPLTIPPAEFETRTSSRYMAALELLAGYRWAGEKLDFAVRWLKCNRRDDGSWDFGKNAGDKVYLPPSDSWRKARTAYRTAPIASGLFWINWSRIIQKNRPFIQNS